MISEDAPIAGSNRIPSSFADPLACVGQGFAFPSRHRCARCTVGELTAIVPARGGPLRHLSMDRWVVRSRQPCPDREARGFSVLGFRRLMPDLWSTRRSWGTGGHGK
jgi:hypothetical protein